MLKNTRVSWYRHKLKWNSVLQSSLEAQRCENLKNLKQLKNRVQRKHSNSKKTLNIPRRLFSICFRNVLTFWQTSTQDNLTPEASDRPETRLQLLTRISSIRFVFPLSHWPVALEADHLVLCRSRRLPVRTRSFPPTSADVCSFALALLADLGGSYDGLKSPKKVRKTSGVNFYLKKLEKLQESCYFS